MKTKKRFMFKIGQLYLVIGFITLFLISCNNERDKHIKNGQMAYNNKYYDLAIQEYEKARLLDSTYAKVYYLNADVLFEKEKYKETVKSYEKAISLDSKEYDLNADICFRLGRSYHLLQEYEKAFANYQKSISLNNKHIKSYRFMAEIYAVVRKDPKNALIYLNKAIEIKPTDTLYVFAGSCYRELSDIDNAIKCYKRATDINPKNAGYFNRLGLFYYEKNEYDNMIDCLKKALDIEPNNAVINSNLGNAFYLKKDYDQSIYYYQESLNYDNMNAATYRLLGLAYLNKEYRTDEENNKMTRSWIKAAQLGDEQAKERLNKSKVNWTKINVD